MNNVIAAHKRLEQTLRHLVIIAEHASEGIAVTALDGTVRFANKAWGTMHGYNSTDELVGKPLSLFHTEQQVKADLIPFINETKSRGQLAGPIEHMQKDGTPFPTETKMIIVKNEQGAAAGLIVFATEITERKRAQNELKKYRARFEQQAQELAAELTATNEKLHQETAERRRAQQELQQCRCQGQPHPHPQSTQPAAGNKELRQRIAECEHIQQELREYRDQLEQHVDQLTAELTAANEKLRRRTGPMRTDEALLQSIIRAKESNDGVVLFTPQELKALSQLGARLI